MLHHLIYQSTALIVFSEGQLGQLMHHTRQRNQAAGITGMLWYDGRRFLQVMEGPAPILDCLFARIRTDCRHARLQVLANGPIRHRQFDTWLTAIVNGPAQPSANGCPDPGSSLPAVGDEELRLLLNDFQRTALSTAAHLS
ncbi:BLUF domain-containing protein [Hymenobacter rubripertinctus]|uniref:BLUF domain-containing protein n=1 Tax=Hymenobacter rubripertinctus TaxID=2029981 RepID=A0A418QVI0_9BACT|nr:BLUF domain-containing protein [Hymenobacter rubripertinctus]RIY09225.1 BLUF domain-containing protein [Hymenobacter rubripertinctus]